VELTALGRLVEHRFIAAGVHDADGKAEAVTDG
jgi:hypothetical protein